MPTPNDIRAASTSLLPDNNLKEVTAADLRAVVEVIAATIESEQVVRETGDAPLSEAAPATMALPSVAALILPDGRVRLTITWLAAARAASYRLAHTFSGSAETVGTYGSLIAVFVVDRGTPYTFKVMAVNALGLSGLWSTVRSGSAPTDAVAPNTPTGLSTEGGLDAILLRWTANAETDLAHYEIFESDTSAVPPAIATPSFIAAVNNFARTGFPSDVAIAKHYCIRAVDTSGNRSAWSASVPGSTIGMAIMDQIAQDAADATQAAIDADTARGLAEAAVLAAQGHENGAYAAQLLASSAASITFPSDFAAAGNYWTSDLYAQPNVAGVPVGWTFGTDGAMGPVAILAPSISNRTLRPRSLLPAIVGRTYKITIVAKHIGAFVGGSATAMRLFFRRVTTAGASGGDISTQTLTFSSINTEQTFTFSAVVSGTDPFISPFLYVPATNFSTAGPEIRLKTFLVEDTTSVVASFASEQAALAYSNSAGSYAAAADLDRLAAEGSAGAAALSESNAAQYVNDAETAATAAAASQSLTADVSGRAFDSVADQFLPTGTWTLWTGAAPVETANEVYPSGKTWQFNIAAASTGRLLDSSTAAWKGAKNADAYAVEIDFTLISGTLQGAAVLLDWQNSAATSFYASASLASMVPGGSAVLGVVTKAQIILNKPAGFTGTFAKNIAYALANWNGLEALAAKNIKFHRIRIAPITADAAAAIDAADIATAQATAAGVSSAEALSYRNAAARITGGGVSKNPIFSDWAGASPANMSVFLAGTATYSKQTTTVRYVNALRLSGIDATHAYPILRLRTDTNTLDCARSPQKILIRAEVEYISGDAVNSAKIFAYWASTSGGTAASVTKMLSDLSFTAITDRVAVLEWYVERPATYVAGTGEYFILDLIGTTIGKVCTIDVHRFDFEEVLANSNASITQRAVADFQGVQSAVISLRTVAGSGGALLELISLANPSGSASIARIHADNIILDGSVSIDHLNVASFTAAGLAVFGGGLESDNYVAGVSGWFIDNTGNAEFNQLVVRRDMIVNGAVSARKWKSLNGDITGITNVAASPYVLWNNFSYAPAPYEDDGNPVTPQCLNPCVLEVMARLIVTSTIAGTLTFRLQGSDDGTTWFSLTSTDFGWVASAAGTRHTIAFKYIDINVTGGPGGILNSGSPYANYRLICYLDAASQTIALAAGSTFTLEQISR